MPRRMVADERRKMLAGPMKKDFTVQMMRGASKKDDLLRRLLIKAAKRSLTAEEYLEYLNSLREKKVAGFSKKRAEKRIKEETKRTLMAHPKLISSALKAGYISKEEAALLREAVKKPKKKAARKIGTDDIELIKARRKLRQLAKEIMALNASKSGKGITMIIVSKLLDEKVWRDKKGVHVNPWKEAMTEICENFSEEMQRADFRRKVENILVEFSDLHTEGFSQHYLAKLLTQPSKLESLTGELVERRERGLSIAMPIYIDALNNEIVTLLSHLRKKYRGTEREEEIIRKILRLQNPLPHEEAKAQSVMEDVIRFLKRGIKEEEIIEYLAEAKF